MTLFNVSRLRRGFSLLVRNPLRCGELFLRLFSLRAQKLPQKKRQLSLRESLDILRDRGALPTRGVCSLSKKELLDCADTILAHEFDLLGSGKRSLPSPLPWTFDFKSGHDFGLGESHRILYGKGDGIDIKVPWELSRFYHAPLLAYAYRESGSEKYLSELIAQIDDWIRKNPFERGPNWMNAMEAGIRAANWCLALECVRDDSVRVAGQGTANRITQSLYEHALFIETHLEYGPIISNHYLSDIIGLVYLSAFLRSIPESGRWRSFAVSALEECMKRQVYDDGVDFESSIAYHRLVTELFGYAALVCRENRMELTRPFWEKLERMFEVVWQYMKPNGHAPQIGDNDNGRLHLLEAHSTRWNVNDHRHLLSLAQNLWPGKQWPERKSVLFPKAHLAILRSDAWYCIIDAGLNGQDGNGGHCHNDSLSFELNIHGEDMIVDPGTGCYTSDLDTRNLFRSTRMHNTVLIDGEEQNRIPPKEEGVFWMYRDVNPRVLRFDSSHDQDVFVAEHDGYRRLRSPIIHQRECVLKKNTEKFVLRDTFRGRDDRELEWNFYIHPSVLVERIDNHLFRLVPPSGREIRFCIDPTLAVEEHVMPFSPSYGRIEDSRSIRCLWRGIAESRTFEHSFFLI